MKIQITNRENKLNPNCLSYLPRPQPKPRNPFPNDIAENAVGRYHYAKREPNHRPNAHQTVHLPGCGPKKISPATPRNSPTNPMFRVKNRSYCEHYKQLIENGLRDPAGFDLCPPGYRIRLGKEVK